MDCEFCNQPITAPAIYLDQNKVYHVSCYVEFVQITAERIQHLAQAIIDSTQGTAAAANSQARRLWAAAEVLKR